MVTLQEHGSDQKESPVFFPAKNGIFGKKNPNRYVPSLCIKYYIFSLYDVVNIHYENCILVQILPGNIVVDR